ncbi:lipid droplet-associated protein [Millisia brevis]|uniref:lipid droplet-associated protein n=1 Tax=Millisia brevis TaxID=264148 RepID=UPI00082B7E10|nr:lipid droplet-associated protein [Millisia brevis]
MIRLPLPARVAAGLAAVVVDEVRKLPQTVLALPITAASQALQTSMRAQQVVAELAIRGDEVFARLERPSEQPEWATFDEDEETTAATEPIRAVPDLADPDADDPAPVEAASEDPAPVAATSDNPAAVEAAPDRPGPVEATTEVVETIEVEIEPEADEASPAGAEGRFALYTTPPEPEEVVVEVTERRVPEIVEYLDYDNLTLAQLRARLRSLSTDDLDALLSYENTTGRRPPFLTMLDNRITSARAR